MSNFLKDTPFDWNTFTYFCFGCFLTLLMAVWVLPGLKIVRMGSGLSDFEFIQPAQTGVKQFVNKIVVKTDAPAVCEYQLDNDNSTGYLPLATRSIDDPADYRLYHEQTLSEIIPGFHSLNVRCQGTSELFTSGSVLTIIPNDQVIKTITWTELPPENFATALNEQAPEYTSITAQPQCELLINDGAAQTELPQVNLSIIDINNNAVNMLINSDQSFADIDWQPYESAIAWQLDDKVYGSQTIYVMLKNADGQTSILCSATIDYVAKIGQTQDEVVVPSPAPNLDLQQAPPAGPLPGGIAVGMVVKTPDGETIYFIDNDNRRHSFPNLAVYFSWFSNFDLVEEVAPSVVESIPLGSNVTIRPGTYLLRFSPANKIYAVEPHGVLRWITTETIAQTLYGQDWQDRILDMSPALLAHYYLGNPVDIVNHPNGSLISYVNSDKVYYIENGIKRLIRPEVFSADFFRSEFVINDLPARIGYPSSEDFPILDIYNLIKLK